MNDIRITHSWTRLEASTHDNLDWLRIPLTPNQDNAGVVYSISTIAPGNCTGTDLASELQTKIKTATDSNISSNLRADEYSLRRNIITISTTYADRK